MSELAPGALELEKLRKANFTSDEIQNYKADKAKTLREANFSSKEIDDYFGHKEPDMSATKAYIENNLKAAGTPAPRGTPDPGAQGVPGTMPTDSPAIKQESVGEPGKGLGELKHPQTLMEAVEAGFGMSVTSLLAKKPTMQVDHKDPMFYRIASQVGMLAGDIPAMVLGGKSFGATGALAGGVAGTFAAPGVGTLAGATAGGAVGTAYGAWATPAAMRKLLMDHYEKGDIVDFQDFWSRASASFIEANKAGVVGVLTAGAGAGVKAAMATKTVAPVVKTTAQLSAEVATMTTVGKAMEGHMPDAVDYIEGAVMVMGLHGVGALPRVSKKMRQIYKETGIKPEQVAEQAQTDIGLKQDLLSNSTQIPKAYESFAEIVPGESKPRIIKAEEIGHYAKEHEIFLKDDPIELVIEKITEVPVKETAPLSEAEKGILSNIGVSNEKKTSLSFDKIYTSTLDDLHPLRVFQELVGVEGVKISDRPYEMARLTRGSMGKIDRFFEFGPVRLNKENNSFEATGTPGLRHILKPFENEFHRWDAYATSMRVIEKEAQGIKTGFDLEQAKTVVKEGKSKYDKSFKQAVKFREETLDYLIDSGVISKEAAEQFRPANKDFIPFHRMLEEGGGSLQKGFSVKSPIKKMKGSDLAIISPVESLIKDTGLFIQLAERNRVVENIVALAEKNPEIGGVFVEKGETPVHKIELNAKELARLKEHGLDGELESFSIFRREQKELAKNEIIVFRKGKGEIYKVHPDLAEVIKNMDFSSSNMAIQIASKFASALRTGTTLEPSFMFKNLIRDQATAFITSKSDLMKGELPYIPFVDAMRGAMSIITKDEHFKNWSSAGGQGSGYFTLDRSTINEKILKINKNLDMYKQGDGVYSLSKKTGMLDAVPNAVKTPFELVRAAAEFMENSTRVGEYKRNIRHGKDVYTAAFESREITLDFARAGAKTRAINQIIPFWNPALQGKDKAIRTIKEDPAGVALKITVGVVMPSIYLWWAHKDDPRMDEIPDYQKDLFWCSVTDDWQKLDPSMGVPDGLQTKEMNGEMYGNYGVIYRIPKPQDYGLIGSAVERTLDLYFKENPRAFDNFSKTLMKTLELDYMPTLPGPMIEHATGVKRFTGRKLIPAPLENVLPAEQYTEHTSEVAKQLGKMISRLPGQKENSFASPIIIENYWRSWTGALGHYVLKYTDDALLAAGVSPQTVKPEDVLADNPFIKSFVIRYPSASAQSVHTFFERANSIQKRMNTIRLHAERQNPDQMQQEWEDSAAEGKIGNVQGMKQAVTNQMQSIQNIYRNPEMSPREKRQAIDDIYFGIISTAKHANSTLDEIEKSLREK